MYQCKKLVRFHMCDPAGVMFFAQYFILMNELLEDWFRAEIGVSFGDHRAAGLAFPFVRVECDFLAPSLIDEELTFGLEVERLGTSSITFSCWAASVGGEERARARLVMVQMSLDEHRAIPFSPEVRSRLARFAERDEAAGAPLAD